MVKVSAGWLIDRAGWKGRSPDLPPSMSDRLGPGNRGGATGSDIIRLADAIIKDIEEKFGITLKPSKLYMKLTFSNRNIDRVPEMCCTVDLFIN